MNIKQLNRRTLILIMGVFLFVSGSSFAQSNEDCLMCHDDDSFTMEKDGKEIPIHVSESKFSSSSHSKLKCISCHTNFDAEAIPIAIILLQNRVEIVTRNRSLSTCSTQGY